MLFTSLDQLTQLFNTFEVSNNGGDPIDLQNSLDQLAHWLQVIQGKRQKVMVIGNGGSAAIASHIQTDLCNAIKIRGIVFNEPPLLSALSNDYGYPVAFERLVELWADPDDLLIAISSSGKSENILRAVGQAKQLGCQAITLSGFSAENPLRKLGDINYYVASHSYGLVEATHAVLAHLMTDWALEKIQGDHK